MSANAPRVSRNFPFSQWCEAKGFSRKRGYDMVARGELATFCIGRTRFVSEEEDARFDRVTRGNTGVEPLAHKPQTFRKGGGA